MATSTTNAAAALGDITRFAEMRKRLLFLLGALVVYRIGTFIPVRSEERRVGKECW